MSNTSPTAGKSKRFHYLHEWVWSELYQDNWNRGKFGYGFYQNAICSVCGKMKRRKVS